MRTCTKCNIPKEETDDNFHRDSRTGRFRLWCRSCVNADNSARGKANREQRTAKGREWRQTHPGRATAISRAWQLRHPERAREVARKSTYGIDFEAMWDAQKGLCACCGEPMLREGREKRSVCVDHDRSCCPGRKSCGKCVRGLIHWACNLVLGYANDDPRILRYAAEYVERSRKEPPSPPAGEAFMGPA